MRTLLFICATAFLCVFISCNTSDGTSKKQAERNNANIKEVYRAIETGDVSKLDAFIADDIVSHEKTPDGREIKGLDSLKKFCVDQHNHFRNLKFNVIAQATDSDYHFTLVNMIGTAVDDQFGMPANSTMNSLFVDVVRLKDGKVVEHWGFPEP